MRIQEIAEQLVNLTVKEVNELSMIMNHNNFDNPVCNDNHYSNIKSSPKKYGQSLKNNKRWMRN